MTHFIKKSVIAFGILATLSGGFAAPAFAEKAPATISTQALERGGDFIKKKYSIKGQWQIFEKDGQRILRLSDDFKTKKGPDLKLFLSPEPVQNVTGKTATNGAVQISVLNSNKGSQDYIIPANIDLAQFQSVLIHCEAYSVLWGGGNL